MAQVRIGLISDTHNLVRPEALERLAGVDAIVHAGDICKPDVLEVLARIAPVTAVRGNNDRGAWADELPISTTLAISGAAIHIVHDIADLRIDPVADRIDVIVSGHSHKPSISSRGDVLYVNPGSAGPRRFKLPVSAGMVVIENAIVRVDIFTLAGVDSTVLQSGSASKRRGLNQAGK